MPLILLPLSLQQARLGGRIRWRCGSCALGKQRMIQRTTVGDRRIPLVAQGLARRSLPTNERFIGDLACFACRYDDLAPAKPPD
eukprot:scaffold100381_cov66-Phaeocystis_antarctica.AAC.7